MAILHRGDDDFDMPGTFPSIRRRRCRPRLGPLRNFGDFVQRVIPGFSIESYLLKLGESLVMLPVMGSVAYTLPMVRKGLWVGTSHPVDLPRRTPWRSTAPEPMQQRGKARFRGSRPLSLRRNPHQTRQTRLGAHRVRRLPARLGQTLRRRHQKPLPQGPAPPGFLLDERGTTADAARRTQHAPCSTQY